MSEKSLRAIADVLGFNVSLPAGPETEEYLASLLQAAHLPISGPADADALLLQIEEEQRQQIIDQVQVVDESATPISLPIRLIAEDQRRYSWTLTEENGTRHEGSFTRHELLVQAGIGPDSLSVSGLSLPLAVSLPCGYHEVALYETEHVEPEIRASQLLIVVPQEGFMPPGIAGDQRIWGLSVQPQAISSSDNWGIGDYTDLIKILCSSSEGGAGTLHIGPLSSPLVKRHTPASSETLEPVPAPAPNPFSPSSRSQLNVFLIDVTAIADFHECEAVRQEVDQTEFQASLTRLRDQKQRDYRQVYDLKEKQLGKLWDCFYNNHLHPETGRGREFRKFQQKGGETLYLFAVFSALEKKIAGEKRNNGRGPSDWPDAYKDFSSPAVRQFAQDAAYDIEFYQYLQWQAELQLATIGRRSIELGLKVGLLGEFPFSVHPDGYESWRYQELLPAKILIAEQPLADSGYDPAVGLPVVLPHFLRKNRYRPFIEGLRQSMRYTGALIITSTANYRRTFLHCVGDKENKKIFISMPFAEMVGIITLESLRNRCLVIADNSHLLPESQQQLLRQKKIFSSDDFLRTKNERREWFSAADYLAESVVRSSPPFLTSLQGFWQSRDIAVKAAEGLFAGDAAKEKALVARAADRVKLLISLAHDHLLPERYAVDQGGTVAMDQSLRTAIQVFLARSPAKIVLVPLVDILGRTDQAVPPRLSDQDYLQSPYPADLDDILGSEQTASLFKSLCRERGYGNVRPSARTADRKNSSTLQLPRAFYRLQLHKGFTFQQAAIILPYLRDLGISHCYLSPFLTARPGSSHGYDIIDHSTINPEIGRREDFENFLAVLERHEMALVLDIVPNHMGIGSDNQWWMDVLENGQSSQYAGFFDINWQPQQADLAGRLLLPVLGDYYGKVLEEGQLQLSFNDHAGTFYLQYFDHIFPISPKTFPLLLRYDIDRLGRRLGVEHHSYQEFQHLIQTLMDLAGHEDIESELQARQRDKKVGKRTLARLCRNTAEIKQFVEENVILFNGVVGRPESFDLLHQLLDEQAYRLAFWRVAVDEINYRRFFDINDLAGLRMEDIEVFKQTHGLILDMVATGRLDGLRIDHPDGLYDPLGYFCRLQNSAAGEVQDAASDCENGSAVGETQPLYIVVEKILADFESLPDAWPISGTTGYDFANYLNGIFVDKQAEKVCTAGYYRFIGRHVDYDQLLYSCKKLIIRFSMAGELNVLTSLLYQIARDNRRTRDLTFNSLRDALIEVICFFPVYRTYICDDRISAQDAGFIEWALAKAAARYHLDDDNVFGFIKSVLLLQTEDEETEKEKYLNFVRKLQQYTGPVMAKGFEDTFFYQYNRLLSLNEVGGNPGSFGISIAAFHQNNQSRCNHWPHAMLATSTHDSKRSEDVRARINVLTEMADTWHKRIRLWSRHNRSHKQKLDDTPAPSKNDEYALYQNLLGAWPIVPLDDQTREGFIERMQENMLKTSRESKVHTSWTNQNDAYENGLRHFVAAILHPGNEPFLRDFSELAELISRFGLFNSLSQVFLKLVSPGIPDIYQGNEVWRFCLVDPDNRREVDYTRRQAMLSGLMETMAAVDGTPENLHRDMLECLSDGRAKMYTIIKTLQLRKQLADVFTNGSYLPLQVSGDKKEHICAFVREKGGQLMVAVAPRLFVSLVDGKRQLPLGDLVWQNTRIHLRKEWEGIELQNIFAGERVFIEKTGEGEDSLPSLAVSPLMQSWPLALLHGRRVEQ